MNYQFSPFVVVALFNAAIAVGVIFMCWPKRASTTAKALLVMMSALVFWSLFSALEMAATQIEHKVFWNRWLYVSIVTASMGYLCLAMAYRGLEEYLRPPLLIALSLLPFVTVVLAFTNDWHHLIWTDFSWSPSGYNLLLYGHGPMYWIGLIGYSYILFLFGSTLMVRSALHFPREFRIQAAAVIIGSTMPFLGSLIYVTGLSPLEGLDITPLSLAFSGLLLGWAVLRQQFLDLVPVARAALVEGMEDGLMVLDSRGRLIDFNPSAQIFTDGILRVGMRSDELNGCWSRLGLSTGHSPKRLELQKGKDGKSARFYEARVSQLDHLGRGDVVSLINLRDITQQKQVEQALRHANDRLKEMATRDVLTGLFNRRYLMDTLTREFARARREDLCLTLAIMDIDYFKRFNDSHGHQAGDDLLRSLGVILQRNTRQEDVVCRYGGEEFVMVLPGANLTQAFARADRIRNEFALHQIEWGGRTVSATLSIGVAAYPQHGEDESSVLQAADKALYEAKQGGRNQVRKAGVLLEQLQFEAPISKP